MLALMQSNARAIFPRACQDEELFEECLQEMADGGRQHLATAATTAQHRRNSYTLSSTKWY